MKVIAICQRLKQDSNMKALTSTQIIKEAAPMLGKINSLFDGVAENSQEWPWTLFRVLSAAMFMTHG